MARITGFGVRNFGVLKEVALGDVLPFSDKQPAPSSSRTPLTPITAVIGKNGVGKSTLFDAFGFLADCLAGGVEGACAANGRGGFNKIRSKGQDDHIEFQVAYRSESGVLLVYRLEIGLDDRGRPFVCRELLVDMEGESRVHLFRVQEKALVSGEGIPRKTMDVLLNSQANSRNAREAWASVQGVLELADASKLAIATFGALKEHPKIASFRRFVEGWYLSYFTPDAARSLPLSNPQQRLDRHGENLANVVQFMEQNHPDRFQRVLDNIATQIPGIGKIESEVAADDRVLLCFHDKGFKDPFFAKQMSDGTLKLFTYLLMLELPDPPSFLCIEEPENGLYHTLLESLVQEFREYAESPAGSSQVFLTTHQPDLVDALDPSEVWVLKKGEDGFSTLTQASSLPHVQKMVDEGQCLGSLWYSNYLGAE